MNISDLQEFKDNPRTLSEKQFNNLKRDLIELGDLSGIIFDQNSQQAIGGNQRVKVFKSLQTPEIIITEKFDNPTKTGTIAHGYVVLEGEKYAYREVKWTQKQCRKANIVANKAGGEWDFNILANVFDSNDLLDWGFEEWEFGIKDKPADQKAAPTVATGEAKTHKCPNCGHEFQD